MTALRLTAALAAVAYGVLACGRRKQPLFFKILLYGCASYFMGMLFEACYLLVYRVPPAGFHVGYLGCMGAYFFLLSSYYGAMDLLADGGERAYRRYRQAALLLPAALAGMALWAVLEQGLASSLPLLVLAVPLALTGYFAMKHLILPDVEMGIIRVMRPYNGCVAVFCLWEMAARLPQVPAVVRTGTLGGTALLLALLLPVAERWIRKWYI